MDTPNFAEAESKKHKDFFGEEYYEKYLNQENLPPAAPSIKPSFIGKCPAPAFSTSPIKETREVNIQSIRKAALQKSYYHEAYDD